MTRDESSLVAITGIGVLSPLGCSIEEATRRFAAGERAVGDAAGLSIGEIPVDAIPAERRTRIGRLDRLCRMFLSASFLAVHSANLDVAEEDGERIGLSFGTGLGCLLTNEEYYRRVVAQGPAAASPQLFAYTVSSAAAGEVSIALGIKGPNVTAHAGLAAGLGAVGYGADLIELGKADVVLAGGADVTGPALASALAAIGLLKTAEQCSAFVSNVPGLRPSEGASVFVLERADRAARRGARPWGFIEGWAAGFEPTLTRRTVDDSGVAATMQRALVSIAQAGSAVDIVGSSAHGTPLDAVQKSALERVLGVDHGAVLLAPKGALGEGFAAAGVWTLALALGLMRDRPPLAKGVGLDVQGRPLAAAETARRLAAAEVVMVNDVCYSGAVVALLARGG